MKPLQLNLYVIVLSVLCLCWLGTPAQQTIAAFRAIDGYVFPIVAARLSSDYGVRTHPIYKSKRHHRGLDLAAPMHSPIRAVKSGRVVFADSYAGYGNLVVIDHGNGLTSHYGHCDEIKTEIGEKVESGAIIATVGKTGKVTGPHLHFEVRIKGEAQDPHDYFPDLSGMAQG